MKADPILKEFGLSDEQIKAINEHPEDKAAEFDMKPIVEAGTGSVRNKILNDPEFYNTLPVDKLPASYLKTVESTQYGRFMNELKDYTTKTLGLKEGEDFTPDDAKKLKTFAEKSFSKYAEKHGKKDVNEIQTQLQKALGEKTELEGSVAQKIADAIAGEKTASGKTIEKLISVTKVASIPGLALKPGLIADSAMNALREKYAVVFNPETLSFDLMQKASPTLAAIDSTGKAILFDNALLDWAKSEPGVIAGKKEEPEIDPKTGKVKVTVEGDDILPGYITAKMGNEVKSK